ncbi:hypothetical protein BO71DRAFT_333764 [Aspergillus ellipticus CBS 707.79]|uniref:Ipa protein n=1 Tax=Aspergillus ellipticus CBS 707.79 TaxID=1448320 RepID=A0A319D133_9EURO|nr:hypothetical protein BO71DRAFT_333764 [Aspergillus ellipticus CBS 707.79]
MEEPQEVERPDILQHDQRDLRDRYEMHFMKIRRIWSSLDKAGKERLIRAGLADGNLPKDSTDKSLGNSWRLVPEWNLKDLAESGSDFVLDMISHRATTSLPEQFIQGVDGGPGDGEVVFELMGNNEIEQIQCRCPNEFTLFANGPDYGSYCTIRDPGERFEKVSEIVSPYGFLTKALLTLVHYILDKVFNQDEIPRFLKAETATLQALSSLTIAPRQARISLEALSARALEQVTTLKDHLNHYRAEPEGFMGVVNSWYLSQPDSVPDEDDVTLPLASTSASTSAFECLQNAAIGINVWSFINTVLQALIEGPNDRAYSATLLQELANLSQAEYQRVQGIFKRHVQKTDGCRHFTRVEDVDDNGTGRIVMTTKPETLTRANPCLHYRLRLCQSKTDAADAVDWIQKLDSFLKVNDPERHEISDAEKDAFGDLTVTVSFIKALSASVTLPRTHPTKGRHYLTKLRALVNEVDTWKSELDLANYLVPVEKLVRPGMTENALNSLNEFIVNKCDSDLEALYSEMAQECLTDLHPKPKGQKQESSIPHASSSALPESTPPRLSIEQPKEKIKTRPEQPAGPITPPPEAPIARPEPVDPKIIKVKAASFRVFSTLYPGAEARGSINWTAFAAAMVDVGFSIAPTTGSIFSFEPPAYLDIKQSVNIHRPHESAVEGYLIRIWAKRLRDTYGWGRDTFEIA